MIIGGQAVLVYGEPRLTKDIDITLGVSIDKVGKIREIVSKLALLAVPRNVESFVEQTFVLPALDKKTGIRVDFIFSASIYERQAIRRGKRKKIGTGYVNFAAAEDVIIHKIIAARQRDFEDVKSIILKNPKMDKRYIERWLEKFDESLDKSYTTAFKQLLND